MDIFLSPQGERLRSVKVRDDSIKIECDGMGNGMSDGTVADGSRLERVAAAWQVLTADDPPAVRERCAADMLAALLRSERVRRG
jgi:hypothetical protein